MPRLLWIGIAAFLASAVPASAAQILVVDSQGPAPLKKGEIIDGGQVVTIPAGGTVVLMDESGASVTINGPYSGAPGGAKNDQGPSVLQRLSAALADHPRDGGDVLGVTRGLGLKKAPTDPWSIDVRGKGIQCLRSGTTAALWRSATHNEAMVTIARANTAESATLSWSGGAATLAWPNAVAIVDGAQYQLTLGILPAHVFVLRVAPAGLSSGGAEIAWLTGAGCTEQALQLARHDGGEHVLTGMSGGNATVFH